MLIAAEEHEHDLLQVEGFDVRRFTVVDTDGQSTVSELERMRSEGAQRAVLPKPI